MMMTQIFFSVPKKQNRHTTITTAVADWASVSLSVCVWVRCLWLYKIKTAKRGGDMRGSEERERIAQSDMFAMTRDRWLPWQSKLQSLRQTPLPPPPLVSTIYLAHSRFSTLSCNLFFFFLSFFFFALFCFLLRFHFLVVCQKFIDLSLVWLWHCSRGAKGAKGCQKPTSCLYSIETELSSSADNFPIFFPLLNLRAQSQKSCQTFQGQCQKNKEAEYK